MAKTVQNIAFAMLTMTLVLAGCGADGNVEVTGTLTNGGTPLEVSEQGDIQVHFIQLKGGEHSGHQFTASVNEAGKFEVEVPTGEYRIAVKQLDPYPDVDKLKGKFGDENSPITKKIEGSEELNIDISKY